MQLYLQKVWVWKITYLSTSICLLSSDYILKSLYCHLYLVSIDVFVNHCEIVIFLYEVWIFWAQIYFNSLSDLKQALCSWKLGGTTCITHFEVLFSGRSCETVWLDGLKTKKTDHTGVKAINDTESWDYNSCGTWLLLMDLVTRLKKMAAALASW